MRNDPKFILTTQAWLIAVVSTAYAGSAVAAAGKVEFSLGDVSALGADGRARTLSKGAEINPGDTIQTVDGRAQVRFSDGGYISLQPNTQFKVEDYAFSGKADGSEKGFFSLVKGGLRAITGAIGHGSNKSAYRVSTPVATIGIRGTEYTANYGSDNQKLNFHVGDGAVYVESDGGNKVFYQGQNGEVSGTGGSPQHTTETPSVGAAGPTNPQQQQQEQQQNQQQQQTFVAGELKTQDGGVCGIEGASGGGCGFVQGGSSFDMAGEIATLNGIGATGNYSGSSTNGGITASVSFSIYFSSYETYLNYFKLESGGGSNYVAVYGSGSGSLNSSTGGFGFGTTYTSSSGSCAGSGGGCSIGSLGGQLNSVSGLTGATVNYSGTFNGSSVGGSVGATGSIYTGEGG
ncbi:hypothetical protein A7981_04760 [Methylovorus sp. MM2]|uniref:FecR family protein n=1 Tax=Methylovorus sp. MM2 TaxID=1848038 RepID=UPI0007E14ACE|nr:FecR family protein [Methylovorus sp. MM2]OAM52763.1 hypothetical protein A7981_04760 [Methylovorus sp. MM2]